MPPLPSSSGGSLRELPLGAQAALNQRSVPASNTLSRLQVIELRLTAAIDLRRASSVAHWEGRRPLPHDDLRASLGPNLPPEAIEPVFRMGTIAPCRRKHPGTVSGQIIENLARGRRQPNRARPGLAVRETESSLAVLGPSQCQDFRLPASGQQQETHDRRFHRMTILVPVEEPGTGGNIPAPSICKRVPGPLNTAGEWRSRQDSNL